MTEQFQFFGQAVEIGVLLRILYRMGAISAILKEHERRITSIEGKKPHVFMG